MQVWETLHTPADAGGGGTGTTDAASAAVMTP